MTKCGYDNAISEAGWAFPWNVWLELDDYQKDFAHGEFSGIKTPNYYKSTLKALSFCNMNLVVDAGCGMGQWSIPLSLVNNQVIGLDISTPRLKVAKALSDEYERNNVTFNEASIESTNMLSESVDGIFCYGVLMFTNVEDTLVEFFRILRPGGKIYINANTYGWYAHLLIDRGIRKRNMKWVKAALKMVLNTVKGKKSQILVDKHWLLKTLKDIGYQNIKVDIEGRLNIDRKYSRPPSVYSSHYYGLPGIIEVIAEK